MTYINQIANYIIDYTPYILLTLVISIIIFIILALLTKNISFDSKKKYFYGIFYGMNRKGMILISCLFVKMIFTIYFILVNIYLDVNYLIFSVLLLFIVLIVTKSIGLFVREILLLFLIYIILIFLMSLKEYLLYLDFNIAVFIAFLVFMGLVIFVFMMNIYFYLKFMIDSEELYD